MAALGARMGWLEAGEAERLASDIEAEVRGVIAAQESVPMPAVETLIEDVFEEPTWLLREQLAHLSGATR